MQRHDRPLRADQIQPGEDVARAVAQRGETGTARAIIEALDTLAATLHVPTVERLLTANDFTRLWRHLALDRLAPALQLTLNRLARVHDRVAARETDGIVNSHAVAKAAPAFLRPGYVATPDVIALSYNPLDTATVAAQNATNASLVSGIGATTEQTAQRVIAQGLANRVPPATIARTLRDTLGTTQAEANAIQSYRRALESGNASSLNRALRDPRLDKMILRGDLSEDQIDRATARYAERYRAFRATTIARTESLRAANQGRAAAWAQYAQRTGRDGTDIRKFWLTAGDELVCPVCRVIPQWNEFGIPMDALYETPIGALRGPPDPHPRCRCTERYERIASPGQAGVAQSAATIRLELEY